MTKFLNISTDNTLGGNSPSDDVVSSQKAIKTALNAKANSADLATVATSGSYNDLSNKPSIPTVGNGTITITQGGVSKGTFTTNQSGNTTIALDAGGSNVAWGSIVGSLANQTDLADELLNLVVMLARKVDKGHQVTEFQAPTAQNNYTWYRKYADGWVEQGGEVSYGTTAVTFPVTMASSNYTVNLTQVDGLVAGTVWLSATRATGGITVYYDRYNRNTTSIVWQVSGMAS